MIEGSDLSMYAISWSGGKDCCSAYWKAVSEDIDIQFLLNTFREDSGRVAFHGVRSELIQKQADALDKTLIQKIVHDEDYEEIFLGALLELKSHGVKGVVFGDIDVRENREWCERVASKAGLDSIFPLWNINQKKIIEDFIESGFKAIVVALDSRFLEKNDLGRNIDHAWLTRIEDLMKVATNVPITHCGENGEYHSFVYGGPSFKYDIGIELGRSVMKNNHWLIDLTCPD